MVQPLDLLIENADIVTMDPARPRARRLGVLFGRVAGLDEQLDGWGARERVDFGGACLLPGFVDAHTHLQLTGQTLSAIDISSCVSPQQALGVIARAGAERDAEWIEVSGYDQHALGRHLTAAELDAACPGRKVWARHASSHASVVSNSVLAAAGAAADAYPDGLLEERAQRLVTDLRLPYPVEELAGLIQRAADAARAQGITFCIEAGNGGEVGSLSNVDGAAYQLLLDAGRLPVRIQLMPSMDVLRPVNTHTADGFRRGVDLGLRGPFGSDRLGMIAQKVVLDGGMQVGTAHLSRPYEGTDNCGGWRADPGEMVAAIVDGHAAGWQMAVHAIGDAAVDLAIDAFTKAREVSRRPDARHRIEHGGAIRPDQLARLGELELTVVTQPSFLYDFGDRYAELLGPDRAGWLYRGRSLLAHGVRLVGSTDRPLPGSPLRAIQTMVERRTNRGTVLAPEDVIDVEQALAAFTTHAAWIARCEDRLGRLATGYLTDLTVLAANPLTVEPARIAEIPVLATAVDGALHWL